MATKNQERKALVQIRTIVADLGEDSYIGKAFEGCYEMATDNIDNDFWDSWKERAKLNESEAHKWMGIAEKAEAENKLIKQAAKQAQDIAVEERKRAEEWKESAEKAESLYNTTQQTADSWCAKYHEANDIAITNWNKFREQEDKVEALEQEIIKLKAKLYDMMVGA